jgi:trimeric autotransporter adhesin
MKKLFSYLLISSMVILSSCTNYDDQFDDLNTQINSLKSQIEGFSSLSSGLTSLQGTVASLQSAVNALPKTATPATDISGLEASVAALQAALSGAATSAEVAALTADLAATQAALDASIAAASTPATDISGLEATVAELKTALAAASTSAEITALTAELAATEVALAAAVAANATAVASNTTDIAALAKSLEALTLTIAEMQASLATVSTAAEVTALATSLAAAQADLTSILASSSFYTGTLTIGTQAQLDFAVSLGDKVKFINGDLDIDQTTTMDATQLASVMAKVLNVTGAVAYTSTATTTTKGAFANMTGAGSLAIEQAGNISLPKLTTVTGNLSLTGSASTLTVSLPVLTKVTGTITNAALGSATTYSMPTMVAFDSALTINIDNAGTVDLSAFTNATNVDGTVETSFDALTVNAATLTAPVYTAGKITANRLTSVSLPKWKFATGSTFDRAATVVLPSVDPGKATSSFSIDIDTSFKAATSVHIIAAANSHTGVLASEHVNVTSTSTKLETLILGGTFTTVSVTGSDVTSITFDGTAHSVTVDGTDIETLSLPYTSAAKGELVIKNNTKLTSVTADKVNGLSKFTLTGNSDLTDISFDKLVASGSTGALVTISGNDLSVETYSEAQTSPTVAKKIVSADLAELKAFIADAISKVNAANKATSIIDVDVDDADIVRYYDAAGDEQDVVAGKGALVTYSYLAATDNSVGGVSKQEEMYISALTGNATFKVASLLADGTTYGTAESVSIMTDTGLENYYDIKNWAEASTTTSALAAVGVSIEQVGKGQRTAEFTFADTNLTNVSAVVTFADGGVETVSVTTGSASTTAQIATAIKAALDAGDGVVSQYYSVALPSTQKLKFTSNAKGSHRQTFELDMKAYTVSSNGTALTPISFASASQTVANNIEDVTSAYIRFKSTAENAAGARSITIVTQGTVSATLLTASGISTAHAGDDEFYVKAVTGTVNTADNSNDIKAVSVNNIQYVSAN